jgi:hypothetical protein
MAYFEGIVQTCHRELARIHGELAELERQEAIARTGSPQPANT